MIFTGHAELTIDAKQRLKIPAKYATLLKPERDGAAWYCSLWRPNALMLYTEARFNELAERGQETLTPGADLAEFQADFFGMTERLEMDAAGRINIPRLHLELAGIGTDVVMIGAGRRLEVRNRDTWVAGLAERIKGLPAMWERLEQQKSLDARNNDARNNEARNTPSRPT